MTLTTRIKRANRPLNKFISRNTRARDTPHTDIDHSDALNILSSERHRLALEYLSDQPPNDPVSVSDLAEYVAAGENDCSIP